MRSLLRNNKNQYMGKTYMVDFIVDFILSVFVEIVVWSDCIIEKLAKRNK